MTKLPEHPIGCRCDVCTAEAELPAPSGSVEAAIAEYFDWLTNQEIACEQVCMYHAANAYALASSKLGTLLIDCKFYQPATPAELSDRRRILTENAEFTEQ